MKSVADAVDISFFIPPMNDGKSHHVISKGQWPKFYRPEDLRDIGSGKTLWVDTFEKIFVGLFLALDAPVPYAFRTPDGKIRSLDAGCMKMLVNRNPPELQFNLGSEGFISTVVPSDALLNRYVLLHSKLRARIVDAEPSDD
ncbi:MAG TPA: hypothetical protein DHV08_02040 [Rhodocyclaceae bacterium]|nr:hypothetical protein [Rhodocyclaceae bacterium]